MVARLTVAERAAMAIPEWHAVPGRDAVARSWTFPDFAAAWGFMTRVALLAERADHHPDWSNSYGTVRIELTTHEAGGLTARDVALAQAIDAIA